MDTSYIKGNHINFENVHFLFSTNLSGDPKRDQKFRSSSRQATIQFTSDQTAFELDKLGFNVKVSEKIQDQEEDDPKYLTYKFKDFTPGDRPYVYFIKIVVNYKNDPNKKQPVVRYVRSDKTVVTLNADTIGSIDNLNDQNLVDHIDAWLNLWVGNDGLHGIYVDTMFVYEKDDDRPEWARGSLIEDNEPDDLPFD